MIASLVNQVLDAIPHAAVYVVVFLLPFLEAAVLIGFVVPGETALIFGGVLASRGGLSIGWVLALAVAGAVLGDTTGYAVGRRYGEAIQGSRAGRWVGEERWRASAEFLRRRGPAAVFLGRFTALLRAMVPGAAGMARMPYRTFLLANVAGGALWATLCVLGSYALGDVVGTYVSDVSYVVLAVVAVAVVVLGVRHLRHRRHPASDPAMLAAPASRAEAERR